jgi:hypothetical protein
VGGNGVRQRPEDKRSVLRGGRRSNWRLLLERELDDHGPWRLAAAGLLGLALVGGAGWLIGGSKRPSFAYGVEVMRVVALDLWGGEQPLDNALDIHNELMIFQDDNYNAFDIAATSVYSLATQFKKGVFEKILDKKEGRVRILMLDPRLALDKDGKSKFEALSWQLGDSPRVTFAQCLVSTFALAEIADALKEYGRRFEVRFYRAPVPGATPGHFLLGRSYSKYKRADPSRRFDIIIPYTDPHEVGIDSPLRRSWRIKDAPQNDKVKAYAEAFEAAWRTAAPLAEVMLSLPSPLEMKLNFEITGKDQ